MVQVTLNYAFMLAVMCVLLLYADTIIHDAGVIQDVPAGFHLFSHRRIGCRRDDVWTIWWCEPRRLRDEAIVDLYNIQSASITTITVSF